MCENASNNGGDKTIHQSWNFDFEWSYVLWDIIVLMDESFEVSIVRENKKSKKEDKSFDDFTERV